MKDCLRKKFPKLPASRKRNRDRPQEVESIEDRDKRWAADKKRKRDLIREKLEKEEVELIEKNKAEAKILQHETI